MAEKEKSHPDTSRIHNREKISDPGYMSDPDLEPDPEVTGPVDEFHIPPSQGYPSNVDVMWMCMRCGYISEFADQPPIECPDCGAPGETMEAVEEDRPDFP